MVKRKQIGHAASLNNGIIFYSNIYPKLGIYTYYNENGKIDKEVLYGEPPYDEDFTLEQLYKINDFIKTANVAIIFYTLIILLFTDKPNQMTFTIYFIAILFVLGDMVRNYVMLFLYFLVHKMKNGKRNIAGRFHSAEHKAILAYEENQRIPTYKEVEAASRFSKNCGSMGIINKVAKNTVLCLLIFLYSYIMEPIINVVIERYSFDSTTSAFHIALLIIGSLAILLVIWTAIYYLIEEKGIFKFMEIIVTNKPTQREINLAIEGLMNYEELENTIDKFLQIGMLDLELFVLSESKKKG